MFSLPMMYGIRNDKTTSNKIDQHNKSSEYQTDISISHLQVGYSGMFFISHAHMVINGSTPNKPQFN
jgi:hypothetical protein